MFLLKVPPVLTSVCQPADVTWFGTLKRRIHDKWVQFVVQQLKDHDAKADQALFKSTTSITIRCSQLGVQIVAATGPADREERLQTGYDTREHSRVAPR